MGLGVDTACQNFNKGMAADAENEKKKYDIAISILATGLAATGAGPLAYVGMAVVGQVAKHVYAGVADMVNKQDSKTGAAAGIKAGVGVVAGFVNFSQGQEDPWATATRLQNVQSVNQSVVGTAATSFKNMLFDRSLDKNGVPGDSTLQPILIQRYSAIMKDMMIHLNKAFAELLTGTNAARGSLPQKNHSMIEINGKLQSNPYEKADIFIAHVMSTRPDLMSRYDGKLAGLDQYLNDVRAQVSTDWMKLFPRVPLLEAAEVKSFANICEAKMWCRVIVNEKARGRPPRNAVIVRLEAVGLVGRWQQSVFGTTAWGLSSNLAERTRIRSEGRLRYHGSAWEIAELQKLAAWIDDDVNVNIPQLAAGTAGGGVPGVLKKIGDYNRGVEDGRRTSKG